jgi:glycosyltransferase involved in cell wall biosynthesis
MPALNIALLHYAAPPVVGGVESVLAHQARLLADAGHSVRIVAGRGAQTDPRIPFVAAPRLDSRHPEVLAVKQALDQGRVPAEFAALRAALRTDLAAALEGVQVLIAHNVCSLHKNLALTAALHDLAGAPRGSSAPPGAGGSPRLVMWHHDLAWTTPRYQAELHPGEPWDLLRNAAAWPGAVHVTISEPRRQELASLLGLPLEAIRLAPNGVDRAAFLRLAPATQALWQSLNLDAAAPVLLLPVRLTPRKNIELALRALAALRRDRPGAALLVTGPEGPHNPANADYKQRLLALRDALDLRGAAHFAAERWSAPLADEVVADLYRLADALILPSREEGFGLPLVEAAFSRLPIFCADIPPLRALAGADAVFFSPDSEPQAVAALVAGRLSADPAYRWAARARAEYTWSGVYARRLAPLLAELGP